ncbi:MAG: saccharopine dehydrogenase C-terminal domain-containing protein [bacterium]
MKRILVLGAGKSSPTLISYLLEHSEKHDWNVTVADLDRELAQQRVGGHPRGKAIAFNAGDADVLDELIRDADIVVNFLLPRFQTLVANACVTHGTHFVSASYRNPEIREMDAAARRKGVLLLNEMGLDPGIDLMSAMDIIQRVRDKGGIIRSFASYGSGIPAPENHSNPLRYVITWNPYNVVMAGSSGAQYLEDGQIRALPYHRVFTQTWSVDVDGVGKLEAYANRDSIAYLDYFGLEHAETMIRGTLRYPNWGKTWSKIINLGLTNDTLTIPQLEQRSLREIVEMFLPPHLAGSDVRQRVAEYLNIKPTGRAMQQMEYLGLFSDEILGTKGQTAADAMVHVLQMKLPLRKEDRDMVILVHRITVEYPEAESCREEIVSTFLCYGDPNGHTGMSKTVGLPAAIAVKLILTGKLEATGSQLPLLPEIYKPVLEELEQLGMPFREKVTPLD